MNGNKMTHMVACKCKNCGKWNSIEKGTRKSIKCKCGFVYFVDKCEKKESQGFKE